MMSRLLFVVLILSLSGLQPARGQDAAMEYVMPDSVVVTASRHAEDVRLTGRRLSVWTAAEIDALPVASVDELLRTVGGVEVQSRGGFGVQSDLTMRGSGFNGVLVLLDGARVNDPMTGHFITDFPVPVSEIARIEVLRGPASALYGPDAIGGVVQVFTYAGLREAGEAPTGALDAVAERGSFALTRLAAGGRAPAGKTMVSGAAAWHASDGMPIEDESGRLIVGSQGEVRTDFDRKTYTAAVSHAFDDLGLFARAGVDEREFGAFHFYTAFPSDTAREATATQWAQVRLRNAGAPVPWHVQVAGRRHEDTYVYNPVSPANHHTSRLLTLQAQLSHTLFDQATLTAGTSASLRDIDSNNLGQHEDAHVAAFAFSRWHPLPRLTVNAGTRLDYDPLYGIEPTPQVSAAYNRGLVTIRGAVGRAVRAPNYVERYFNTARARPSGGNLGNPGLDAERAWSYEAGADVYPAQGVALRGTAFIRHTDDLIDYAKLAPTDTVWLARNILDVRTRGLELDADAHRRLRGALVHAAVTYAWLDADLGEVAEGVQYKYALTNARHLLQATSTVDVRGLRLGLQGLWKERLTGESYAVLNGRAAYRLEAGPGTVTLSVEARNLFDVEYTEVFNAPMPGRWWIFGVRLRQ